MPVDEPHRVVCHLDRLLEERGMTLAALAEADPEVRRRLLDWDQQDAALHLEALAQQPHLVQQPERRRPRGRGTAASA